MRKELTQITTVELLTDKPKKTKILSRENKRYFYVYTFVSQLVN